MEAVQTSTQLHNREDGLDVTNCDVASELGYDIITKDNLETDTIILFARTNREKEEWFQKIKSVIDPKRKPTEHCYKSEIGTNVPSTPHESLDLSKPILFHKSSLGESMDRDPSICGNFEGTLESHFDDDDRIEFASVKVNDPKSD